MGGVLGALISGDTSSFSDSLIIPFFAVLFISFEFEVNSFAIIFLFLFTCTPAEEIFFLDEKFLS